MGEPRTVSGPRTLPGGIQLVGPLVRIPGRMLSSCPADVAELEQHIESCRAALAVLRAEFPELDRCDPPASPRPPVPREAEVVELRDPEAEPAIGN